jgi:hypothetical protein
MISSTKFDVEFCAFFIAPKLSNFVTIIDACIF